MPYFVKQFPFKGITKVDYNNVYAYVWALTACYTYNSWKCNLYEYYTYNIVQLRSVSWTQSCKCNPIIHFQL
jgi:hypothetical protein